MQLQGAHEHRLGDDPLRYACQRDKTIVQLLGHVNRLWHPTKYEPAYPQHKVYNAASAATVPRLQQQAHLIHQPRQQQAPVTSRAIVRQLQ